MQLNLRSLLMLLTISIFAFALACGDDDNGNDDSGPDDVLNNGQESSSGPNAVENGNAEPNGDSNDGGQTSGSVSFDVNGDVEGQMEGHAHFSDVDSPQVGEFEFTFGDSETFLVQMPRRGDEAREIPDQGTYTITSGADADFYPTVRFFEDGDEVNSKDFASISPDVGSIEITSSSSTSISGTFELEATRFSLDSSDEGSIEISNGEFTAILD